MSSQGKEHQRSLTFSSLLIATNAEVLTAPLEDLRKVLQDGPRPFSERAASNSRNELLTAVFDLKDSIQTAAKDKNDTTKLFDMPAEELVRPADVAKHIIVRVAPSDLRYEEDLKPWDFEPSDFSRVIPEALNWKLDATHALQNSLSAMRE